MAETKVQEFTSRVIDRLRDRIESIIGYSHPFTNGGLVIVFKADAGFMPDLIADVYNCGPPNIMPYCLRRTELFQISGLGVFGWPNPLEEKPLLAYRIKFGGEVIYGRDIRNEIAIADNPTVLLESQLQRCKQFIRNWALDQFRRRNYNGIIREMDRQSKYLMATALLAKGEWDVPPERVPILFESLLKDTETKRIWTDINLLSNNQQDASRESAAEAVWLFEKVLQSIGRHIQ